MDMHRALGEERIDTHQRRGKEKTRNIHRFWFCCSEKKKGEEREERAGYGYEDIWKMGRSQS